MIVVMVMADALSELQGDGIYAEEQTVELLIAMRASIICPAASEEAAQCASSQTSELADPMQLAVGFHGLAKFERSGDDAGDVR